MTPNSFGLTTNNASTVTNEVCNAIILYVEPKYLHLPKSNQEMKEKISEFEIKFGMIQVFGCNDDTHILIVCFSEHSRDYFCYKQFHSLTIQAVCRYKGTFMDIGCKWSGSVHIVKVFDNSSICKRLRSSHLPTIFQTISNFEIKITNCLIGDLASQLLQYCMKEYSTCKSNDKVVFNSMLRSARNLIDCAFGRLKARWQVLTKENGFQT